MSKKQTLIYGITVAFYFPIGNILLNMQPVTDFLLGIADRNFWSAYFDIIYYGTFAVLFIVICHKELLGYIKDFRENYKKYAVHVSASVVITLFLIVVTAIILDSMGIGKNPNDTAWDESIKISPILKGFTVILIGPYVEEAVFREFLYERVRRKIGDSQKQLVPLWIFVMSFFFMIYHCSPEDFTDLKLFLSYLTVFAEGVVMTGLYEKDRNIFSSLLLHCIINLIAFTN